VTKWLHEGMLTSIIMTKANDHLKMNGKKKVYKSAVTYSYSIMYIDSKKLHRTVEEGQENSRF
jgi:hypothetical protein